MEEYLITWNFRDTLISRFRGSHISRLHNFAILRKFCILTHFNFVETIERFKQLVEQHCKEPVNRQFEDSGREEVLPGVETESSSDEEDENITIE